MTKSRKPQDTSARFATRVLVLANAAVQEFNALAADRALAQRAAIAAALPRQRLAELRALYTAQAALPENARVHKLADSTAFEFCSAYGETRSLT